MRLLHVDTSARRQGSNSRALSVYFVDQFRKLVPEAKVDYIDLAAEPFPHVSELFTAAMYTPEPKRSEEMRNALTRSDLLVDRLLAADAMLCSTPMYNFGMPSALKAFIDHIVRPGRTHTVSSNGKIVGRLSDLRALFITTRGADLRPGSPLENWDALTPSLRAPFAFIGLNNIHFVDVQPIQFAGEERKEQALVAARAELDRVADLWAQIYITSAMG